MIVAGSASPLLLSSAGGYNLTKSLRFRSSASAYLNRTPASAGNRRTYTWSGWVKRGILSSGERTLFNAGGTLSDTGFLGIRFTSDDKLDVTTGSTDLRQTTQVFRDPSAWYHIVVAMDTTQATGSNRVKVYLNGTQITAFSTSNDPSLNLDTAINNTVGHAIGLTSWNSAGLFDGYMTEINFIDGQALTPSSFGQTSATTGVWQPIKYTGTYGTNGFYLPFTDVATTSGSNAGLGKDFSGNGNYWTTNNISVTTGTTYDSMSDVPTLTSATTANYCTWNPLDKGTVTVTNGNLSAVSAADAHAIRATMGLPLSGKFYWETTVSGLGYGSSLGIASATSILTTGASSPETRTYQWGSWFNTFNSGIVQYGTNQTLTGGTNWSGASQLAANDVLMIAVDMDNGSMWVGKNGTWFNSSGTANPATNTDPRWTGLGGTTWFAYYSGYGSTSPVTANINFGQQPFAYTPPTGFVALNTFNLPTPTIGATAATTANKYFDVSLYTGNGSTQSITNSGSMQPDWAWIKVRSSAASHALADSVRGSTVQLASNLTDAEITRADTVTSFNSNGFSLGANTTGYSVNLNTATYVAWQWRASNTTAVTNTAGSITSTVSANTTAGFSIVTWTGNGASSATIGHGLGVAPSMIIVKNRSATWGWFVYNKFLTNPNTGRLQLNLTNGEIAGGTPGPWNNTAPTSTVFSLGDSTFPEVNGSGNSIVAYCFAQVAGYSAFGSYTGNGSTDGVFLYTGFRPRYILIKRTNDVSDWWIWDTARNTINVMDSILYPNDSAAEYVSSSIFGVDALSNGFKMRTSNSVVNGSSQSYIYMAFAESPFKYANAR